MNCVEFKKFVDSYLGDELMIETNHEMLQHIESCAGCRQSLAEARENRARIRSAFIASPEFQPGQAFADQLRRDLRSSLPALPAAGWFDAFRVMWPRYATIALLVGLVSAGVVVFDRSERPASEDRAVVSGAQTNNVTLASLASEAIGDHINCAIKYNLAEQPVSLEAAAKDLGDEVRGLDQTVMAAMNKAFPTKSDDRLELIDAHYCLYNGRRFVHLEIKQDSEIVSLIVAETDTGQATTGIESFNSDGKYQASGFRAGSHAVFVVSAFSADKNGRIASAVQEALTRRLETARA